MPIASFRMRHPPAEALAVAEQAVDIVYGSELQGSKSKKLRAQKVKEFRDKFMTPYTAAEMGQVDMVIDPRETRAVLIRSLSFFRNKRVARIGKKHGNIPV